MENLQILDIKKFEAHITIEPVFGDKFLQFESCCGMYKFRPAELLLQKQRQITPVRSNKDSFCTGHGTNYREILQRTESLVADLKSSGFEVWRYKIEEILFDKRTPPLINIK